MANDVVLGAAMRSNLLTLQNTQRSIDATQLRLATGKKINSALDGPQNFFTAQSLNNRASDLTRLLDGIGQSIQTITEADKGVTALTKLVEQADAVVNSARDELAASDGAARLIGNVDLRNATDIFASTSAGSNDRIVITTTNDAGAQITENIVLTTGDSAYTLAAKITDQFADSRAGEISAKINATTGFLEISSKGGRTFKIGDGAVVSAGTANGIGTAGYNALGIGRYFELEQRGVATNNFANATVVAGNTARSISLYEAPGNLADVGDVIQGSTLTNAAGTTVVGAIATNDTLTFQINNGAVSTAVTLNATTTWQDVIDTVNGSAAFNTQIRLGWDSNAGQFTITSLVDSVENVSLNLNSASAAAGRTFNLGLGDPTGNLDPYVAASAAAAGTQETLISFNSSTEALDAYASDFNTIRSQINDLVKDAEYRGVNLLRGDNLTTFFNEDNTSKLITAGQTFTADGLGLTLANFGTSAAIETMSGLTREALKDVRSFGASLANNLSIIQTRQTFTQETINTLKAGASALTDADLNEEGASLLALQTAQQLGVTSLSLASQSQQSVLRLF